MLGFIIEFIFVQSSFVVFLFVVVSFFVIEFLLFCVIKERLCNYFRDNLLVLGLGIEVVSLGCLYLKLGRVYKRSKMLYIIKEVFFFIAFVGSIVGDLWY